MRAYDWAFMEPVRKTFYDITITALSVAVALVIGLIELIDPLSDKLSISTGPLAATGELNLNYVGFAAVALFVVTVVTVVTVVFVVTVVTWVVALAVRRFERIEEKRSARLKPAESE